MTRRKHLSPSLWARVCSLLLFIVLIIPTGSAAADGPSPVRPLEAPAITQPESSQAKPSGEVTPASAELIQDGGFELNIYNPYWNQADSLGYQHLCSTAYCGSGQSYGPRTGTGWAWVGGRPEAPYWSEVWQTVAFPACGATTTLRFYLKIAAQSGASSDDALSVIIDDTAVYTVTAAQKGSFSSYTAVSINVSSFADGGYHAVDFYSYTSGQIVNFNIDDVSLTYSGGACAISGNAAVPNVTMGYVDGSWKYVLTDGAGNYSLPVSWGWSGSVTPQKAGFTFSPSSLPYTNVTGPVTGQDYTYLHTFADVPVLGKEWMEPWILAFYGRGVTTGCGAGPIYCPEQNVTRAEMAVFLLRAKHGAGYTPPPANHYFSDMPVLGKEWMEPWVDAYYREGLTTGCGGGNFCPENNVTRAEMAVFVLRALHPAGYQPPAATNPFTDVPVTGKEWMEPWIVDFKNHGITTGCGGGMYCPENNVTRAEMAVFIGRAYNLYP